MSWVTTPQIPISVEIEGAIRSLGESDSPLNSRISTAVKLAETAKAIQESLEAFKKELRGMCPSLGMGEDPKTTIFQGVENCCVQVNSYPPSVRVKPFPIDQAKAVMGGHFDRIFKLTAALRTPSVKPIEELTPDQRKWLSQWLEVEETTARVSFRVSHTF